MRRKVGRLWVSGLEEACVYACLAGMMQVRQGQTTLKRAFKKPATKEDGTLVTATDNDSESAILAALNRRYRRYARLFEERGLVNADGQTIVRYKARYIFIIDALDGTFGFVLGGPTSTVVVAVYDTLLKRVVAVAIGIPATGQMVFTSEEQTWVVQYDTGSWKVTEGPLVCTVWDGELTERAAGFVDRSAGYTRKALEGTSARC